MAKYEFKVEMEFDGENGGVFETAEQERLACVSIEAAIESADFPEIEFGDICPTSAVVLHPKRIS